VVAVVLTGCGRRSTSSAGPVTVNAGVNDPQDPNIAVLAYLPASVTIKEGGVVHWQWTGTIEPHSVTFTEPGRQLPLPGSDPSLFAPTPPRAPYDGKTFVNSGLQPLGRGATPMDLTFSKAGTYTYHCVIHPNMAGTVKVVAKGSVDSAADVTKRADREKAQWLAEGRAAKQRLASAAATPARNPDGSSAYKVQMGASTLHTDVLAFGAVPSTVRRGDRITFVNDSGAPHTASFFGRQPPLLDPTDPKVDSPIPGPSPQTLNPTALFNSGLLPPNAPPGAGPPEQARSFTYVAGAAGAYSFICILHVPSGMAGAFVVT
jgi:plastocyanin